MSRHLKFRRTLLDSIEQAKISAIPALAASKYLYGLTLFISVGGFFHLGAEWAQPIVMFNIVNLFFATAITSLVGSAVTLGQPVPLTLWGLIKERQFWRYVIALFLYWLLPSMAGGLAFALGITVYVLSFDPGAFASYDQIMLAIFFSAIPAALACAYVTARLAMLLPAIAAGERVDIAVAWNRASGNVVKIAAALLIAVGALFLCQQAVADIAKFADKTIVVIVASIAVIAITFCQSLLNGTLAGAIYRQLGE
jgi:hypothetical protein